jgi:F-type H+-transporting ATPase subunit gamma
LALDTREGLVEDFGHQNGSSAVYEYEPGQHEILDEMIPRFTALQVYQAVLESQASEHAARMIAMRNATDNAKELVGALQLAYNKVRQQAITNDILDIVGGAEALAEK